MQQGFSGDVGQKKEELVQSIVRNNNLKNANYIEVGMRLAIKPINYPGEEQWENYKEEITYTVEPGDNVYKIAESFLKQHKKDYSLKVSKNWQLA